MQLTKACLNSVKTDITLIKLNIKFKKNNCYTIFVKLVNSSMNMYV